MPRSRSSSRQNKSQSNKYNNQTGGDGGSQGLQISDATLRQAGEIAQKLIGQSMKEGNVSQTGGSASGVAPGAAAASDPASPQIHNAMVGGAVAGAVAGATAAAEAAESKSGLNMSPLVGGRRRKRGSKRFGLRKNKSSRQNQNQNQ